MEVPSLFEGVDHGLAFSQMRKHSQFQLSVISNYKLLPFICDKSFANFVNILIEGRLVLDVWLATGKTSCFSVDVD